MMFTGNLTDTMSNHMYKTPKYLILAALMLVNLWACQKALPEEELPQSERTGSSNSNSGSRLSYGDTLFYLRNQPGDYTIMPVSRPAAPGIFKAIPQGLVIDSVSGRVNVTRSETGLRYKIFYLDAARNPVDSVKLVISGIDYADSIYQLRVTPNAYDTAFPIYNARPELPLPCSSDDDDDDGCIFDETDLNNDGNDDIPGVIQDKLLVDIKRGTIDAEASFHAGIFGSSNPANGIVKNFTMYYRLNDASNMALNKINIRVYHYRRYSDIPQSLLDEINARRRYQQTINNLSVTGSYSGVARYNIESRPKRPPLIIIVSQ
jgi:hypothetical protein